MSLLPIDSSGFQDFLDEAKQMLKKEVDYKSEKAMTDFFREAYAHDERIKIPKTYARYSTTKVLATQFCEGISIDSEEVKALSQQRKDRLSQAIIDSYFYEIYDLRYIQSDTHFGNFKVELSETGDKLVMLDFGACKKYKKSFVKSILDAQQGVWDRDRERVQEALLSLEIITSKDSREIVEAYIELVFLHFACYSDEDSPYYDRAAMNEKGQFYFSRTNMFQKAKKMALPLAVKTRMRSVPKDFIFFGRKSMGIIGILAMVGGAVDIKSPATKQLSKLC
jgi:predicted unusual protein kinase regulating ubiquinone biosynthesis (AarF/ABC1/UbiB family)